MKAIVLAAGYATRMYPLTKDRPKPLLPVGSKRVLDYLLERLATVPELDTVFVVTNSRFYPHFVRWRDEVRHTRDWPWRHLEIVDDGTWDNETRLGAIGDIHFVIRSNDLDDELIISSGDNIFPFDFSEPFAFFRQVGADTVTIRTIDDLDFLRRTGVVEVDASGRVIGFQEKPKEPKSKYACPTLYFLRRETVPLVGRYLDEGNDKDAPGNLVAWLHKVVPVYAWHFDGELLDIGHLDSYAYACKVMEAKENESQRR